MNLQVGGRTTPCAGPKFGDARKALFLEAEGGGEVPVWARVRFHFSMAMIRVGLVVA